MWLGTHMDLLIQGGVSGKRLYAWQIGQFYIANWDGGSCGSDVRACLETFDNLYGSSVEFKNNTLPREYAVRGWLENQSLVCLASHATIEFMYSFYSWMLDDQPEDINGFNNITQTFHIQHFPYLRRIASILGSIKDSNVSLSNRLNVAWCVILNRHELTWRGGTYNISATAPQFSIIWPMIGATQTCAEHGIPYGIVDSNSFTSSGFSNAGVVIVPFPRNNIPSSIQQELSQFNGLVIWMTEEFSTGNLTDNFHNTVDNGGITNAQISRNQLWSLIQTSKKSPSIITEFVEYIIYIYIYMYVNDTFN